MEGRMRLTILLVGAALVSEAGEQPKCPLPGEWELNVEISDEFDGPALDKAKWWDYAPHWPGRPGVYRTLAKNVSQKDGDLHLLTDKVSDAEIPYEARMDGMQGYTCALVKSRKKVMYGYFEARIKELAFCPSADYHTYGLLWTKDELVWYVDNVESARMTAVGCDHGGFKRPLHVVFDTEVNDWSGAKVSDIDATTLPATAKVAWFRHWRRL